ncbi:sensor histidine kinase [Phaeobacter marinintestinus]|uniref:sensor histidine kinase n=1 Tax=Falsiphaeobacter marinintestinus TaxID=1492905 RepID=UPI0011B7E58C|nr:sensor histidine kinase [Phaeobacter marinintestinus]
MAVIAKYLFALVFAALATFWQAGCVLAAPAQSIEQAHLNPLPDAEFLIDPTGAFSVDSVLAQTFQPLARPFADFGFVRDVFWLKAEIVNPTAEAKTRKLSLEVPYVAEMTAYLILPRQSPQTILKNVATDPFSTRSENYRNLAADLTLPAETQATLLIRYRSDQSTQLQVRIETPAAFYSRIRGEDVFYWSLMGILAGIVGITVLYLTSVGFRPTMWFAGYMAGSALYLAHTDGYAFAYLWPNSPNWNSSAVALIGLVVVALGTGFARAFVDAPVNHPVLNRTLVAAITGNVLWLSGSLFFLDQDWYKIIGLAYAGLCAVLQLITGIAALRRGHPGAGFFMVGLTSVSVSVLMGVTGYLIPGLFDQDIAGRVGQISLLVEAVSFSSAIFRHHETLRDQRDTALAAEVRLSHERLELSEALYSAEKEQQDALRLAEARRAQLASTAHDIRQPLASLRMAMLDMNRDDSTTASQIGQSFDYLETLVRQNLDATHPDADWQQEAATENAPIEHFPASIVLNNIAAMFRQEAAAKGLDLRCVPSSAELDTDPVALTRIVMNLVANAIKHTETGRILIGCRRLSDGCRIEVHDTGAGMTPEEIDHALQPYALGENSQGTGLGLAVVADLARAHGARFELSSQKGRGTSACVTISRPV